MNTTVAATGIDWGGRQVQIEYQWLGSTDPSTPLMVFLHEGLGSLSMWRDFPQRLCTAVGMRGLVFSRPGYGQSTPRDPDQALAPDYLHRQACEVLPALFDALRIDPLSTPPWIFGHSDGASIALLYAATWPDHVAGAVLLAPHTHVENITVAGIEQTYDAYLKTDLRQRLARHHADADSVFRGWYDVWLSPAFRNWSIEDVIARIACPLLAVQGLDDVYGTLEQIRGIARRVPQTVLLELGDCGHSPHRDQADRLIRAVSDFLQHIKPKGP